MPTRSSDKVLSRPLLRLQPDRRLVALTGDGSEAASEEIVRRYRPALVRYAGSIVGPDRAEDVVQDSLAKAIPAIHGGIEELHLRPWLYTVVHNTALNALRDAGPAHEQLDENYDGVEQPPQALERQESVRSLLAGMRELPDAQRQALVKREMEGRSHEEIAAQLGVSAGAARQLIFRARDALRAGIGSLVPMPLLRYLFEGGGGDGGAVAAGAATGGSALAAKAALALVATGAVVGGGLAVGHADRKAQSAPPPVVTKSIEADLAEPAAAAGSEAAPEGDGGNEGSGGSGRGSGDGNGGPHRGRGRGDDGVSGSSGEGGDRNEGRSPDSGSGGSGEDSGHSQGGSGGDGPRAGDTSQTGASDGSNGGSGRSGGGSGTSGSGDDQPAAVDADSGSGDGESPASGSSGPGGSGSEPSGGSGGGSEPNSEISRDSGGDDGFQG